MNDFHESLKEAKNNQIQQISKIKIKAESDLELLESLYEYTRKKAEVEAEYAKSLYKLNKGFQIKKLKKVNKEAKDSVGADVEFIPTRPGLVAFFKLIEESEAAAVTKELTSQKLSSEIVSALKDSVRDKSAIVKTCLEHLTRYINELHLSFEDLDKTKAQLDKAEKELSAQTSKYESLTNNPKSAINVLKTMVGGDTEERRNRARQKMSDYQEKVNAAAAEYTLAAESVNIQMEQYYSVDLKNILQRIDAHFQDKLLNLLNSYIGLEIQGCSAVQIGMNSLQPLVQRISHENDVSDFLAENSLIFQKTQKFNPGDKVSASSLSESHQVMFGFRLALFRGKLREINDLYDRKEREISALEQMINVYSANPQFGDAENPVEQFTIYRNDLDYINMQKIKVEKQIEIMESMGVTAREDLPADYSATLGKSLSKLTNIKSSSISLTSNRQSSISSLVLSPTIQRVDGPQERVQALYDYEPACEGELRLKAGDIIMITGRNTGSDAWWEGSSSRGKGQFPSNYVKVLDDDLRLGSVSQKNSSSSLVETTFKVRALYDYTGHGQDELSFKEGDLITVLDASDPDWWKGKLNGKTAFLPKIYVERV